MYLRYVSHPDPRLTPPVPGVCPRDTDQRSMSLGAAAECCGGRHCGEGGGAPRGERG